MRQEVNSDTRPYAHAMAEKLATPQGCRIYARRKWLSEAPHGWIKQVLGFRRFSVRGWKKAQGEWDLVCLALNVKRPRCLDGAGGHSVHGLKWVRKGSSGLWPRNQEAA